MKAYFPVQVWYEYHTGNMLNITSGTIVELAAPLDEIPVFIRGGYVVPFQHPSLTTTSSRKNSFGLLIALNSSSQAEGTLFWDDGYSIDSIDSKSYNLFQFSVINLKLIFFFKFYNSNLIF